MSIQYLSYNTAIILSGDAVDGSTLFNNFDAMFKNAGQPQSQDLS